MDNIGTDRAISIRQPYVEQILRGDKNAELRSMPTKFRGKIMIYAGLRPAEDPIEWENIGKVHGDLPTGVIVGTVEIVGCEWDDESGLYAYALANPQRFKTPLKAKNQPQPRFWRPVF